jgi:N-acetyl sugar amidotransferase
MPEGPKHVAEPNVFRCTSCLNMSTRPRILFDEQGRCNACQWAETKRSMDWTSRMRELDALLERQRSADGAFDCVVPVSGGKDGSYVAYRLKHDFGMNPLAITIRPPLALPLGDRNLYNFVMSGYSHIHVTPDPRAMQVLNRQGFIEKGFPYFGWLISMQAAVVRLACQLRIGLIFYGEDGEVEYGGTIQTSREPVYTIDYMKQVYLEGGYDHVLQSSGLDQGALQFFRFPCDDERRGVDLKITHWSYFESWDPYRNYLVAKAHCGLEEADATNSGTFTNFAQNDQALYALHAYLMYLKFGFGRATQDAGIEIRRGAMTREQGLNLVRLYDGQYPEEFIPAYLDYYEMKQDEFDAVLARWANKDLFELVDGRWEPRFPFT